MAKTSKTTKKAVVSSGKKKGVLGRSFNLKSRKVQFVVSILVIAIVGAGYFTFKSFAGTISYTFNTSNMKCRADAGPRCSNTTPIGTGAGKGTPPTALVLENAGQAQSTFAVGNQLIDANTYRLCATILGIGELNVGFIHPTPGYNYNNSMLYAKVASGSYQRFCSGNFQSNHHTNTVWTDLYAQAGSGKVQISNIDIELMATPASPPPPPPQTSSKGNL